MSWLRVPLSSGWLPMAGVLFLFSSTLIAGSGQWSGAPDNNDWEWPGNWIPKGIPNGSADTATFSTSSKRDVLVYANNELNGVLFSSDADAFGIIVLPAGIFQIRGLGIQNNSAHQQSFLSQADGQGNTASLQFRDYASAGLNTSFHSNGGLMFGILGPLGIEFFDNSTAGQGKFVNEASSTVGIKGGETAFHDNATAGTGTFINNAVSIDTSDAGAGVMEFFDFSTAGHATITNNPATSSGHGGSTTFFNESKAEEAMFINNGLQAGGAGAGITAFGGDSTADHATSINNGGSTLFFDKAGAGSSRLVANAASANAPAGYVVFVDYSTGGTARVEVSGEGRLEISTHGPPGVTIGSLEGDGAVFLGPNNLTIGSNDRTTDFYGVIQEGAGRLPGGTLTKIGKGTLDLAGAGTFPGLTTLNGGGIQVEGALAGPILVNSGRLGGSGTVASVTVNAGGLLAPGADLGILNINGQLNLMPGSTYLCSLFGTHAGAEHNQANVSGKVSLNKASLVIDLEYFPSVGDSWVIIKNGAGAIKGKFQGLREGAKFVHDGLKFKISYKGGDGNDVVLTRFR